MKTPIAVTLIIAGSLLISAPIIADYLERAQISAVLAKPGVTSANLGNSLSEIYRFGCWVAGVTMIAAAIVSSRRSGGA